MLEKASDLNFAGFMYRSFLLLDYGRAGQIRSPGINTTVPGPIAVIVGLASFAPYRYYETLNYGK